MSACCAAVLAKLEKPRGLFTRYVNPALGTASDNTITLGARVDSIYEYFLKQWLQSGRVDLFQKQLYDKHVDAIRRELLRYTKGPQHYAYFQELLGDIPRAKMVGEFAQLTRHCILHIVPYCTRQQCNAATGPPGVLHAGHVGPWG